MTREEALKSLQQTRENRRAAGIEAWHAPQISEEEQRRRYEYDIADGERRLAAASAPSDFNGEVERQLALNAKRQLQSMKNTAKEKAYTSAKSAAGKLTGKGSFPALPSAPAATTKARAARQELEGLEAGISAMQAAVSAPPDPTAAAADPALYSAYQKTLNDYGSAVAQYNSAAGRYRDYVTNARKEAQEYRQQAKKVQEKYDETQQWLMKIRGGKSAAYSPNSKQAQYLEQRSAGYAKKIAQLEKLAREAEEDYYSSILLRDDYAQKSGKDRSHAREDGIYSYINDTEENRRRTVDMAIGTGSDDKGYMYAQTRSLGYLTDEERGIYNYIYTTEGKEAAADFLATLGEALAYREGAQRYGQLSGTEKALYWIPAGLEQFFGGAGNTASMILGRETTTSPIQYTSGMVRQEAQELSPVLGVAYDVGTSTANMAPSVLMSFALGGLGAPAKLASAAGDTMVGVSAAGNAYNEALKSGYTKSQARVYATLSGASEALLQYALGGIEGLGGIDGDKVLAKIAGMDNAIGRLASSKTGSLVGKMLVEMTSEGTEEFLQDLLEPAFDSLIRGTKYEVNFADAAYSYLLGALSAGAMNSATGAAESVSERIDIGDHSWIDGYPTANGKDYFKGIQSDEALDKRYRKLSEQMYKDGNTGAMEVINRQYMSLKAFNEGERAAADNLQKLRELIDTLEQDEYVDDGDFEETDAPDMAEPADAEAPAAPEEISAQTEPETAAQPEDFSQLVQQQLENSMQGIDNAPAQEQNITDIPAQAQEANAQTENNPLQDTQSGQNTIQEVTDNGGQQQQQTGTGNILPDGNRGRLSGESTGEQAGQLAAGTEGAGRRSLEQSRTAAQRQNTANVLRLERTSAKELGISRGTDSRTLTVMPEASWDEAQRTNAERIQQETGKSVTYVLGPIQVVDMTGQVVNVRGVYSESGIVIQADHARLSIEQISDHEIFHDYAKNNPGLVYAAREAIREQFGAEQFDAAVDKYIRKMRGYIDVEEYAATGEAMTGEFGQEQYEEAMLRIAEEMCADAYAGINAYGANAAQFRDTVQSVMQERGAAPTAGRENAAATERTTAPPDSAEPRGLRLGEAWEDKYSYTGHKKGKGGRKLNKNNNSPLIGKQFPMYNVYGSDTNTQAIMWVNRKGVLAGQQHLLSHLGDYYVVERSENADFGYYIVEKIDESNYDDYYKMIRRHNLEIQESQGEGITPDDFYAEGTASDRGERPDFDADIFEHGRETREIHKLGEKPLGRENVGYHGYGHSESGNLDIERQEAAEVTDSDDKTRFSLDEDVEEVGSLVAVHNATQEDLERALELGALPSPSIAIVKAEQGHTQYGDYSLVFPRSTIDPEADSRNKVYGGDAWTPTHSNARIESKVNYDILREVEQNIDDLAGMIAEGDFRRGSTLRSMGIEDVTDMTPEEIARKMADRDEVRAAYLADKGQTLEPVRKEKVFNSKFGNDALRTLIDRIGEQRLAQINFALESGQSIDEAMGPDQNIIRDIMRQHYMQTNEAMVRRHAERKGWNEQEIQEQILKRAENSMERNVSLYTIEDFARNAWELYEDGGTTKSEIDRIATSEKLRQVTNRKDVEQWALEQIQGLVGKQGVYNGADLYTDDGQSRDFDETHWEVSAENIVRAMNNAPERGAGYYGVGATGLHAAATSNFANVDQMHAEENRLQQLPQEEYDASIKALDEELDSVIDDIIRHTEHHADNTYEEREIIGSVLMEAAQREHTAEAIRSAFKNEGYDISSVRAGRVLDMLNHASEIPTTYFEAKPKRVVGFDEAVAVIAPDNADPELVERMRDAGLNVMPYEAGNEQDRLAKLNSLHDIRFSLDDDVEPETRAAMEEMGAANLDEYAAVLEDIEQNTGDKISAKINSDVFKQVEQRIGELSGKIAEGVFRNDTTLQSMRIEEATDATTEEIAERMASRDDVKAAYLADQGQALEPVRKGKVFDKQFGNETLQAFIDRIGVQRLAQIYFALENGQSVDEAMGPDQDIIRDIMQQRHMTLGEPIMRKRGEALNWSENEIQERLRKRAAVPTNDSAFESIAKNFVKNTWEMYQDGGTTKEEIDKLATSDLLKQSVNQADVKHWAKEQIEGLIEQEGVNRKGNRYTNEESDSFAKQGKRIEEDMRRLGIDNIDDYTKHITKQADEARLERLRSKTRDEFKGTEALEKHGVKIAGALGDYSQAQWLRGSNEAYNSVKREARKAENRLKATGSEKLTAKAIAEGTFTDEDYPASVRPEVVDELVDWYSAEHSQGQGAFREVKAKINDGLDETMENIFAKADQYKSPASLFLEYRTPERSMRHIFKKDAPAIIEAIFDPVRANEAEKYRFINREFDRVRSFEGSDGKKKALNKQERELVQMQLEHVLTDFDPAGETNETVKKAAELLKDNATLKSVSKKFKLNDQQLSRAQEYGTWLRAKELSESKSIDKTRVENAVKVMQELYDDYYDMVSDFLAVHGFDGIGYIKGYAPHMQPEENKTAVAKAFQTLGLDLNVDNLPTSIAGLTADYKPNKRWNPHFQQRLGERTAYDAIAGFENYISYMADILYHTDDVMRIRAASRYFRRTFSSENISDQLSWARNMRAMNTTFDEKLDFLINSGFVKDGDYGSITERNIDSKIDEYVDSLYKQVEKTTAHGSLVTWLDNYANLMAGKQHLADRSPEYVLGRRSLNFGNSIIRAFSRSQVAGNMSSVLNQTAQLSDIINEIGPRYMTLAMKDMVAGAIQRDNWYLNSDFLTGKAGIKYLDTSAGDKLLEMMYAPAQAVDTLLSTLTVRGEYIKQLRKGKSEAEAMRLADLKGEHIMGSRMKGSAPTVFNAKNPVWRAVNLFAVENLNSFEHHTSDFAYDIQETIRTKGTAAGVARFAMKALSYLSLAFVMNRLADELYGGTPAPMDFGGMVMQALASGHKMETNEYIATLLDNGLEKLTGERAFGTDPEKPSEEFDTGAAIGEASYNLMNDIPLLRNVSGVMGWGDNTLPMPDVGGSIRDIKKAVKGAGWLSTDTGREFVEALLQWAPGGRQLTKTMGGIETILRGGRYTGYGEDKKLQAPGVDDTGDFWQTVGQQIQAAVFGNNALRTQKEYYASDNTVLSVNQTKLYDSLVKQGANKMELYDTIQKYREVSNRETNDDPELSYQKGVDERALIGQTSLTDKQKLELYEGLTGAESRAEKFQAMYDAGLDWDKTVSVYDKYAELDQNEDLKATQKATQFAKWVDEQSMTKKQKAAAKEQFMFWQQIPAEAESYEKYIAAGMSTSDAAKVTELTFGVEGDVAKMRSIVQSDMSKGAKADAIGALIDPKQQMYTEKGALSAYGKFKNAMDAGLPIQDYVQLRESVSGDDTLSVNEKLRAAVDAGKTAQQQFAAAQVAGADDSHCYKMTAAYNEYNVEPEDYVKFRELCEQYNDDNENINQSEAIEALNHMQWLNESQKAALFALQNTGWKSNPYSTSVGEAVVSEYKRLAESGEGAETESTASGSAPSASTTSSGDLSGMPSWISLPRFG